LVTRAAPNFVATSTLLAVALAQSALLRSDTV
jgi:hypothetical protein